MAEKDLAIQYKRQYAEAIEADYDFTTAQRTAYLTDPLRYKGQIVFDSDQDKLYRLNGARNAWVELTSGGGGGGHVIKDSSNTSYPQQANLKFIGATVTDNAINGSTDITITSPVSSVNGKTGSITLVTDDISEDGSPINLWFTVSRVLAVVLTGLSTATSTIINSTDTFLIAFGKLQAQITTLLGRIQNSMTVDGTGLKIPTVDAVNTQTNNLAKATTNIGLVAPLTDTFQIARADDTHLNVTGTSVGVIFPAYYDTPPYHPSDAIRQIPTNTAYPLQNFLSSVPTNTQAVYYLGWRDSTQTFEIATTSYVQNPLVFQCGVIFLKNTAGVISFIDSVRTVIPVPDISQYSNLETTAIGVSSNVIIKPVAGGMTVRNLAGSIVGLSVNYKGTNNDEKPITANNPVTFLRLNPGNAVSGSLPSPTTTVVTTDYWNGTAMTTVPANGNATVQRWLLTIRGGFNLQVGEQLYTTFADAVANADLAPFTEYLPKGTYVELCRMICTKDATDLTVSLKTNFIVTGGTGSGGGGGATSVPFLGISGSPYDNAALSAELARITTDILPAQQTLLSNTANWSAATSSASSYYIGSTALSGNKQGQFYFDGLYYYFFIADDYPIRLTGNTNGASILAGTLPITALTTATQGKVESGNTEYVSLTTNPDTKTTSDWMDIKGIVYSVTEDRESLLDNTSISAGSFVYDYRVSTSATPTVGVSFATLASALVNSSDATKVVYVRAVNTTSTVPAVARLNIKRYN